MGWTCAEALYTAAFATKTAEYVVGRALARGQVMSVSQGSEIPSALMVFVVPPRTQYNHHCKLITNFVHALFLIYGKSSAADCFSSLEPCYTGIFPYPQ